MRKTEKSKNGIIGKKFKIIFSVIVIIIFLIVTIVLCKVNNIYPNISKQNSMTVPVLNILTNEDSAVSKVADISTTGSGISRVADTNTVDSYKTVETGGRNNGRIWTDKSVYSHDENPNINLDNKFEITYNEDFLTVFSALGSSQLVKSPEVLDMMFVVDISGSMGKVNNNVADNIEITPMYKTVEALNNAIKQILSLNPKTRIGITVYGTTSALMLPVANYSAVDGADFLQVEKLAAYGSQGLHFKLIAKAKDNETKKIVTCYADNAGSSNSDYNKERPDLTGSSSNAQLEGTSGHTEGKGTETEPYHVGHITNQQAGLARGLEALAKTDNTCWTLPTGQKRSNIPCMIHLTDGQASDISPINDTSNWYNVDMNTDLAYTSIRSDTGKYNVSQLNAQDAGVPMIYQTLMTASYYTSMVNKHYRLNASKFGIEDLGNISIKSYSIYASDSSPLDQMDENNRAVIQAINSPSEYFIKDSNNEIIKKTYNLFEEWMKGNNVENTYTANYVQIKLNSNQSQIQDDSYGIEVKDVIENINYIQKGNFLSTGFDGLSGVIEKIVQDENAKIKNPIGDNKNEADISNALSYVDPIGKYMEVKDVKKLLLFGQSYNVIEGETESEKINGQSVTKQYYKAVGDNNEDIEITNPSYIKETKFKLSDIKIWKEISNDYDTGENSDINTDFDEALHITIPAAALPIELDKIELDSSNNVTEYETNMRTDSSLPIRILYTVGLNSKVFDESAKKINLTKLSREYFTKQKEEVEENGQKKTYINFYSNYYSGEVYDEAKNSTFGNAAITFTPSADNNFYIFQKYSTIYKKSEGGNEKGEGELVETGGNVELSDPVTDLTEIEPESTYYFETEYYIPSSDQSAGKGKHVKYAISHEGKDFFGTNEERYITYYNTKLGEVVDDKGENVVVATKKGAKKVGNLQDLSSDKSTNLTKTANTYYAPTYGHMETAGNYSIITYLGNNGKLSVQTTELLITKTVQNSDKEHYLKASNKDFEFKLTLNGDVNRSDVIIYKCEWNGNEWFPKAGKTYVITNNNGYILKADGTPTPYWVGTDRETQRKVKDDGTITVYNSSSEDGQQILHIFKDSDNFESDYKLDVEMQVETLNFVEEPPDKVSASFTLKDGEGILLTDLGAGTAYTVTEENTDNFEKGYEFLSVNSKTGDPTYSGSTVAGQTEKVNFVNKYTEVTHDMQISKTVVGTTEQQNKEWTFNITLTPTEDIVLQDSYEYEGISAIEGVTKLEDGTLQINKNSDGTATGTITLKHGQAIKIKNLAEEIKYKITENEANTNDYITTYHLNKSENPENYTDEGVEGYMSQDQFIDFTNLYSIVDFKFTKVANEDTTNKLSGAKFALYELDCKDPTHNAETHDEMIDIENVSSCWREVGEAISGKTSSLQETVEDGIVKFDDLSLKKEYRLIELEAPLNRTKPTGQWKIQYKTSDNIPEIKVVGNANKTPAFMEKNGTLLLPNMAIFMLPNLGGGGTAIIIFVAFILIFIGCYRITLKKRKRRAKRMK